MPAGTLIGLGTGPGDPELLTLKAVRLLAHVPVVASFAKRGRAGHARTIAAAHLAATAVELRFEYPFTIERTADDPTYRNAMTAFYDEAAESCARHLDRGEDVAVLCEGDPFFYGSFMYLFDRLADRYATDIVPGITSMSAGWTQARAPITHGDDVLVVLPATLSADCLVTRLQACDAAVILKIGRHLAKVRKALTQAGLAERAIYIERASMASERILPLADAADDAAPYFSLVLVPGRQGVR